MLRPGWFFIVAGIVAAAGILSWLFPLHRAIEVNEATVTQGAVQPTVLALGTVVAPLGGDGRRPATRPQRRASSRIGPVSTWPIQTPRSGAPVVGGSAHPAAHGDECGSSMSDVKPD